MTWSACISELKQQLPRFNDELLIDYRRKQIEQMPEFIAQVFKEATHQFDGRLIYKGYQVLTPEKHASFLMENQFNKGKVNIQHSELSLVRYIFDFDGEEVSSPVFVPIWHNNSLQINDTKYDMLLGIVDRIISKIPDGVIVKVMRSPLKFWRNEHLNYTATNGTSYDDAIIFTQVFFRRNVSAKNNRAPLILYLLAQLPFDKVKENLGIELTDLTFEEKETKDPGFIFFKIKDTMYLKAKEELMNDINYRRFIASIIYILNSTNRSTVAEAYSQTLYRVILGRQTHGAQSTEAQANNHASDHLKSFSTYLDSFTKKELMKMRIYCDDIFDLITTVFLNIDKWTINGSVNNLFEKRIVDRGILLEEATKTIFNKFYTATGNNKQIDIQNVRALLNKMSQVCLSAIRRSGSFQLATAYYNDNVLTSMLIKRVRQTGASNKRGSKNTNSIQDKGHQFHPSFVALESALTISSSSPGVAGDINPYAQIDDTGWFREDKMPWYKEIEGLSKYLVQV